MLSVTFLLLFTVAVNFAASKNVILNSLIPQFRTRIDFLLQNEIFKTAYEEAIAYIRSKGKIMT
jgi:hypothetical protein